MTQQAEALRLAQFAMDRQTHLGSCRNSCDKNGKAAWDDYAKTAVELRRLQALVAARAAPTRQEIQDYLHQQGAVLIAKKTYEAMRCASSTTAAPAQERKPLALYQRDTIKANAWRETRDGGYWDTGAIIDATERAHGIGIGVESAS